MYIYIRTGMQPLRRSHSSASHPALPPWRSLTRGGGQAEFFCVSGHGKINGIRAEYRRGPWPCHTYWLWQLPLCCVYWHLSTVKSVRVFLSRFRSRSLLLSLSLTLPPPPPLPCSSSLSLLLSLALARFRSCSRSLSLGLARAKAS